MSTRNLAKEQPESFAFTADHEARIKGIIAKYPKGYQASAVIPMLDLAQRQEGWVTKPAIDLIAERLGMPVIRVLEVATFYTMYNKRPVGRHLVQVCTNISCNLCGADEVLDAFLKYTDTELGETSEDGGFTIIEAECLAGCGFPTCVQINSRYFENVTPTEVPKIIEHLKSEGDS